MIGYNLELRKLFSMNIVKYIHFCCGINFEWRIGGSR